MLKSVVGLLFCSIFFGVVFLPSAHAQNNEHPAIPLPLLIKPNSKATIVYTETKEGNNKTSIRTISATLEIQKATDEGFIAIWTASSIKSGGVIIKENSTEAASFFIGIPIQFTANKNGLPFKIHDRKTFMESAFNSPAFADKDPKIVKKTQNFFNKFSDEALAQQLMTVPIFMSICQGTNLNLNVIDNQQKELPGPFGNGAILTDIAYHLSSVDSEQKQARIEYRANFNPESLKRFVDQAAKKMAPEKKDLINGVNRLKLSRSDSADCTIDTETGWIKTMRFSRKLAIANQNYLENYDISVSWLD